MSMKNTIIYLLGFPATGKLTIAKEICRQADVKLVHNHLTCNPVFSLIHTDGITPLPDNVWKNVAKIRDVVFDTMIHLSPPEWNFVLTNALNQNDPDDAPIFKATEKMAQSRNALFVPVRLLCDEAENLRRVVSPERKLNMKEIAPEGLIRVRKDNDVFISNHTNELSLDVTRINPEESAKIILDHVSKCP